MKRLNEYFLTNQNKRNPTPAIPIAEEEESSLICDSINLEEPGKYLIYYIIKHFISSHKSVDSACFLLVSHTRT